MIQFFINQSKAITLFSFLIIGIGAYYFLEGQKEGFPNIGLDTIIISTPYPGASAEDVDKLVSKKIISSIDQVEGKDEINSVSREGISTIIFTIDSDSGILTDKIIDDIDKQIDTIKKDLPSDVEDSNIQEILFQNVIPVIQVTFYPKTYHHLKQIDTESNEFTEKLHYNQEQKKLIRKIVDEFENKIGTFQGIGKIDQENNPDPQIWVEVDQKKLNQLDIDINEVSAILQAANFTLPGGTISVDNTEYIIKTQKNFQKIEDVQNTILRSNNDGKIIRIKDIANVKWAYEELEVVQRIDNTDTTILTIFQQEKGDIIKISKKAKELIEEFQEKYPNIKINYYNDLSFLVERRLKVLSYNASIGLILVFLCLFLFFDFKVTFWTTLGIPFSFCLSIIVAYQMGITLNMMSMFGFIIVLGMIVDDAIIVGENIYRHHEEGKNFFEAAIIGTQEVIAPIVAITATTVAAFGPLMLLPGLYGDFLGVISIVVIITMSSSFIECLFVLPGHLAFLKESKQKKTKFSSSQSSQQILSKSKLATNESVETINRNSQKQKFFDYFKNKYTIFITIVMKRPLLIAASFLIVMPSLIVFLFTQVPIIFFPSSLEKIEVILETRVGNSLEQTTVIVDEVKKKIDETISEEVIDGIATIGSSRDKSGSTKIGSHLATIILNLDISKKLNEKELVQKIENSVAQVKEVIKFEVSKQQGGPPPGNPVDIEIYNDDLAQLYEIVETVKKFVSEIPNTTSESTSLEEGKPDVILSIDENKAKLFGIDFNRIAQTIRYSFEGKNSVTVNTFVNEPDDIDILIKLDKLMVTNFKQIGNIQVKNSQNRNIPVNYFTDLNTVTTVGSIARKNNQLYAGVFSQLIDNQDENYNSFKINQIIQKKIPEWEKEYPRTSFVLGGEQEEMQELSRGAMIAVAIALCSIFIILTMVFKSYIQPFIIMSIVPFSILGVLFGLLFTGHGFGLMPIIGIVGLIGIVVNDSLVMVDTINRQRRQGMEKKEAVIFGARNRFRPILMTTITTIVGIGPLAYGIGGSEPFLEPMAVSLFWGLIFSTVLLLIFLPITYYLIDEFLSIFYRKFFKKQYMI